MSIPSPYFANVPVYGQLDMEQIIVDYDYPLLSVLKDLVGKRYLCMCFDTRGAQQWLITPITTPDLIALLENRITLVDSFLSSTAQKILAVLDYETRAETFQLMFSAEIPEECLPEAGEYLDADPGEWDAYIRKLRPATHQLSSYPMVYGKNNRHPQIQWNGQLQHNAKAGNYSLCMVG